MKRYDLIFSTNPKERILRHTIFWILVLLFFEATYFLPYYWYPGWNTGTVPAPVAEVGWNKFYLLVFLNSLPGMMAQIFFTYA
ncbi:MAG: hypothetical protein M3Y85_02780, partial [Bacteroidota bacterium]|nr:hypothetical protein [Bacteroidota bacterium]